MLRTMKHLEDYAIRATDSIIGHVKDFYFDDQAWVIRYLVVDTGTWLSSRKVLISPISIGHPDWTDRVLPYWGGTGLWGDGIDPSMMMTGYAGFLRHRIPQKKRWLTRELRRRGIRMTIPICAVVRL